MPQFIYNFFILLKFNMQFNIIKQCLPTKNAVSPTFKENKLNKIRNKMSLTKVVKFHATYSAILSEHS